MSYFPPPAKSLTFELLYEDAAEHQIPLGHGFSNKILLAKWQLLYTPEKQDDLTVISGFVLSAELKNVSGDPGNAYILFETSPDDITWSGFSDINSAASEFTVNNETSTSIIKFQEPTKFLRLVSVCDSNSMIGAYRFLKLYANCILPFGVKIVRIV